MSGFGKIFSCVALAAAVAAVSVPASAQKPPTRNERAQDGKLLRMPDVDLIGSGKIISTTQAGEIAKKGKLLARLDLQIVQTARLKNDTLARRGAYPQSVPAGTILFQVGLDNGVAYCAPMQPDQGVRRTQCFRDLNNDGLFDAAYVTEEVVRGRHIYGGRLQGLAPMPPTPYELAPGDLVPSEPIDVYVRSTFLNTVYFDYRLNGRLVSDDECELKEDKICRLFGVTYRLEIEPDGVRVLEVVDNLGR